MKVLGERSMAKTETRKGQLYSEKGIMSHTNEQFRPQLLAEAANAEVKVVWNKWYLAWLCVLLF